jgi:PLP dependent protein
VKSTGGRLCHKNDMTTIAQNLDEVRRRLRAAALRSGRDPAQVRLVAVSKTVPVERLKEAVAAGQRLFGENYLQEARPKIEALGPAARWHFIGHLQSNKAKPAVALFELIHGVDRLSLAQALNSAAATTGKIQDVLIQINLAGEASKSGESMEAAPALLQQVMLLPHLRVLGLMTMPPFLAPEALRPYFRALRELRDHLHNLTGLPLPELSMGMSGDFEVAIEEGATLVRVGTAIFGSRG